MRSITVRFLALCAVAASIPLYGQKPQESINGYIAAAGDFIVKFRSSDPASRNNVQALTDANTPVRLSRFDEVYLFHSRSRTGQQGITAINGRVDIAYAEPNYLVRSTVVPNDTSFGSLWGLNRISAPSAWDQTIGSAANVVGVIDTGVDYTHPDLAANVWAAPSAFTVTVSGLSITCPAGSHGFNALTNSCDPRDDAQHGTHVSGTIGAVGNNSLGVAGVNWKTQIMALKFLDSTGSGYTSDAVKAIDFAIQAKSFFGASARVRVLSASWGGGGNSQSLSEAIARANQSDMLFVAAAGNASSNTDAAPQYPAGYHLPNVISVAATDSNDALASFSNYGTNSVHLGAPGLNVYSTVPGGGYEWMSGTSMATPHVSGAAMLVLSACALTTAQLKSALLQTVDSVPNLTGYTASGGRLNVARALTSCTGSTAPTATSSIWAAATPTEPWTYDGPVTLGVKFRSDVAGQVNGIRFWKNSGNDTGTHIGLLYSNAGVVLAQATFTSETGSGWQQVTFSSPVAIAANTTYVAAYFTTSGWSADGTYFLSRGVDAAPLHVPQYDVDGAINGVYTYGASPQFPVSSRGANYWVDVLFSSAPGTPTAPASTTSIWTTGTPTEPWTYDGAVTLGVKFRSDMPGQVNGVRFWKISGNDTGTHIGLLYSNTGGVLAQAIFTSETDSGWQQVTFSSPVSIAANTTYVAAYFTPSGWSADGTYFLPKGAGAGPLHALQYGVDGGNGVYTYGDSPQFPVTSRGANYWVDILYQVF